MTLFEEIAKTLGIDVALKLSARFGEEYPYIPKLTGYTNLGVVKKILKLFHAGNQPHVIALHLGLERDTIIDVLERRLSLEETKAVVGDKS